MIYLILCSEEEATPGIKYVEYSSLIPFATASVLGGILIPDFATFKLFGAIELYATTTCVI